MNTSSSLKFNNIVVTKFNVEVNGKFDFKKTQNIKIQPNFKKEIFTIDDNNFINQLTIIIKDGEEIIPFNLEIVIRGQFELENWKDEDNKDLVNITSTATIFPYLRSYVSQASTILGMPQYTLPLINVAELFKENK